MLQSPNSRTRCLRRRVHLADRNEPPLVAQVVGPRVPFGAVGAVVVDGGGVDAFGVEAVVAVQVSQLASAPTLEHAGTKIRSKYRCETSE